MLEEHPGQAGVSTFNWGIRDEDGYYYIQGRTDDVINVAGHRLGTREIEEAISGHANVAEVAVVGVADGLKGQVAMASWCLALAAPWPTRPRRGSSRPRSARWWPITSARWRGPHACASWRGCPRRAAASCCAARSRPCAKNATPGDLTTIDDPATLQGIRVAVLPKH